MSKGVLQFTTVNGKIENVYHGKRDWIFVMVRELSVYQVKIGW